MHFGGEGGGVTVRSNQTSKKMMDLSREKSVARSGIAEIT
jgi:hypothetical protein